jgi:molecular chaperone GrpE
MSNAHAEDNVAQIKDALEQMQSDHLAGEEAAMKSLSDALKHAASDAETSGDASNDALSAALQEIEALKAENAELKDLALRNAAEAENIRKRAERTQADTSKYAVTSFAKDLVSVFENLIRATESITEEARASNEQIRNLAVGVDMTKAELEQVFAKNHIARIYPMGEKFDHNKHQAMLKVETDEHESGTIVQVLQAGYVIHDRLLQPALVGVARSSSAADDVQHYVDTQA